MVNIHEQWPVVSGAEQAREWMEHNLDPARAEELARHGGRPVADFEWIQIGRAVGNVRNQGAGLITKSCDC